jgi:hypothetical protein
MINSLVLFEIGDLQVLAIRDPINCHEAHVRQFTHQRRNLDGVAWENLHFEALRAVLKTPFIVGKIPGADEEKACSNAALRQLFVGPKLRFHGAYPSHVDNSHEKQNTSLLSCFPISGIRRRVAAHTGTR